MKRKLRVILPLVVVAAGLALAAVIVGARPEVERRDDVVPPPLVRAVTVNFEEVRLDVESNGTVEPLTESTLVAQVAGEITRTSDRFADGAFFEKGSLLVRIDPRDYELRVAQTRAQVAQAQVGLERELAEAELARQEWDELGEGEPTLLTLREPQLAEARAQLAAAEAALEQAALNLRRTEIRAPFDGRIRERRVDLGQFVGAGTAVAVVFSTDSAEIRLPVGERELSFLDVNLGGTLVEGPEVEIRSSLGGSASRWAGRIVRSDSQFNPKTRMLDLFARVDDPFGLETSGRAPLPMGLFVEAHISGRPAENVVVLPREAIREGEQVLIVEDERLRFRDVEVLRRVGDRALVTAGLAVGEVVCVSPLETVVEDMSVRVQIDDATVSTDADAERKL